MGQSQSNMAYMAGFYPRSVGLLAATLYSPIRTYALTEPKQFGIAIVACIGLMFGKMPSWLVVLACALASCAQTGVLSAGLHTVCFTFGAHALKIRPVNSEAEHL
jgi:hypothetical protein